MARAGNYVLGLMDDADRDRAERDLEIDPDFRDAVMRIAERMHMFDLAPSPEGASESLWKAVAERIANMPQMRPTMSADTAFARPPAPFPAVAPSSRRAGWNRVLIASVLIAVFVLGFLAGSMSEGLWR